MRFLFCAFFFIFCLSSTGHSSSHTQKDKDFIKKKFILVEQTRQLYYRCLLSIPSGGRKTAFVTWKYSERELNNAIRFLNEKNYRLANQAIDSVLRDYKEINDTGKLWNAPHCS